MNTLSVNIFVWRALSQLPAARIRTSLVSLILKTSHLWAPADYNPIKLLQTEVTLINTLADASIQF